MNTPFTQMVAASVIQARSNTTNNRMELKAAVEGLKLLRQAIRDHGRGRTIWLTDSQYVANNIYSVPKWRRDKWMREGGSEPVLNKDLWQELEAIRSSLRIYPTWTRRDNNKAADKLAKTAAKNPTHTDFGFNPGRVGRSVEQSGEAPIFFEVSEEALTIRVYRGDGQVSSSDPRCKIRFEILGVGGVVKGKAYIYAPTGVYTQLHRHHTYVVETRDGEIIRILKKISDLD